MRRCSRLFLRPLHCRAPAPRTSLVTPQRTLLDFSRGAKDAGLTVAPEDPLITSKLAAVDQTNPLSTVLINITEDAAQVDFMTQLIESLPELEPGTAWVPIVGCAVVLRALHCIVSRVGLSRKLEKCLPHSHWFYRKHIEFLFWRDKQNVEKMKEIKGVVDKYKYDNNLAGQPNSLRKQYLLRGIGLAGFNLCALYLVSQLYSPQLTEASFFWVPSLLQSDPLYVLPAANAALSWSVYKFSQGVSLPINIAMHQRKSIRTSFNEQPVTTTLGLSLALILGGKLFLLASDQCQSLYLLYWTASNMTGLLLILAFINSDAIRSTVGLLPKHEFRYLLKEDIPFNPEVIESEKRKLEETREIMLEQKKKGVNE